MLGAVVVTFRPPPGSLSRAVRSVLDGGGIDRVVVVDNGGGASGDLPDDPRLELVVADRNGGFGAAANEIGRAHV